MTKRIFMYAFPFVLLVLEYTLRASLKLDTKNFMGPTLAAVGLRLLLPLAFPKTRDLGLTQQTQAEIASRHIFVMPQREKQLIEIVWLLIFTMIASWAFCVYSAATNLNTLWLGMPMSVYIGMTNYFLGVILTEVKEVI